MAKPPKQELHWSKTSASCFSPELSHTLHFCHLKKKKKKRRDSHRKKKKRSARVLEKGTETGPRAQTVHNRGCAAAPGGPLPLCMTLAARKLVPVLTAHILLHVAQNL